MAIAYMLMPDIITVMHANEIPLTTHVASRYSAAEGSRDRMRFEM